MSHIDIDTSEIRKMFGSSSIQSFSFFLLLDIFVLTHSSLCFLEAYSELQQNSKVKSLMIPSYMIELQNLLYLSENLSGF